MSHYKEGVCMGIGIEVLGIIYAILCVWRNVQVPALVPLTILAGIMITMSVSFAAMREDQKGNSHKKLFSPKIAWIVLALLVILTLWLTLSCAFGL